MPKRAEHNWVWSPQGVIDMHRPERWGYLQFSEKADGVKYAPDPAQGVKDSLHRVYYAQREYKAKHAKFAASVAELGLKLPGETPEVQATRSGYEASAVAAKSAGGKRWTIREDAAITHE